MSENRFKVTQAADGDPSNCERPLEPYRRVNLSTDIQVNIIDPCELMWHFSFSARAQKKSYILCHTSAVFGVLPILKSMLLLMFLSERTEHGGNLLSVFAARVGFFSVTRHDLICFVVSPREKSKPEWVWKRGKFSLIRGEYIVFSVYSFYCI